MCISEALWSSCVKNIDLGELELMNYVLFTGTRAAISATLTTSLQDGGTSSEYSDQTTERYDSTSTRAPAFRLGAGHPDPFSASYPPLSILSTDTQMPSLPLESIFPVLTNSTRG